MILWFDNIGSDQADQVGGKGANLGECSQAGLPVPPGFVVLTDAYRQATQAITGELADAIERGDAAAARQQILDLPVPPDLHKCIADAYGQLGEPPVAVRSSATAEDLADASFAGQQDTYLGIRGRDALIDAVRRCWASLWTDRAVEYRRQQRVIDDDLALAVVVQQMVAPEVAGVLFTRNPMGDSGAMLVSSAYGLGESVVAALVTPDSFTLGRNPVTVLARDIGSKETRIDAVEGGGTRTTNVAASDRERPSLSDDDLTALVELGQKVEDHYGTGQDLEWAIADGELYLLQARPITTGESDVMGHSPVHGRTARTLRDDLIEHYPGPYPLDLLAVHAVQEVVQESMRSVGLKATPATDVIDGDDDGIIRITATAPRLSPRLVLDFPRTFREGMSHNPDDWSAERDAGLKRLENLLARGPVESCSDSDLARLVTDAVGEAARTTSDRFLNYLAPMMVHRSAAQALTRIARMRDSVSVENLYENLDYTTAVITSNLGALVGETRSLGLADTITGAEPGTVRTVLASTPEGLDFKRSVTDFLDQFGARTTRMYLPFSNRSWREDPESLYALLAVALRGEGLGQTHARGSAESVKQRLPKLLRGRWNRTVNTLRSLHVGREGTLYLIEEFFVVARQGMDEIARRLRQREVIDAEEDIRFLYYDEVTSALQSTEATMCQKAIERRRRRRGAAEAIWWDKGDTLDDTDALRGTPGSSGKAIGPVRIVRSPADFGRLEAGDVLVCPYTDPTWTPLFSLATAVVSDTGGPLSHAAIVAREYGIPAVLGTGNGTSRLTDGQRVTVNGSDGAVTVENPLES